MEANAGLREQCDGKNNYGAHEFEVDEMFCC
jgi:hypothetical protein